jgi:hypothetical protein
LAACVTGCLFISFVFLYGRSLYDTRSALFSSALALTSLGSIALFGTLNLAWLPVAAAAVAFGIFSLAYLGKLGRAWYIPSYLLAAVTAVTGGSFMLWFFLGSSLALIMLDLARHGSFPSTSHRGPPSSPLRCCSTSPATGSRQAPDSPPGPFRRETISASCGA